MQSARKEVSSEELPASNTIWLIDHLHEPLIRKILENLLNFKATTKELSASLFQLNLVMSSLPQKNIKAELFKEILQTLSKTMVTYKDDDDIIRKVMSTAQSLPLSVDFPTGLHIFLFLAKQHYNQGAVASLEAIAFLMYIYVQFTSIISFDQSFDAISILTSSFLSIKDGLVSNVNVAMFIHDTLLSLTSVAPSPESTDRLAIEGRFQKCNN